ncbi:MAG: hypothetical protein AB1673_06095 [Actinomycetota bacterium]|jgi:hypothetical protein
MRKTIAVGLTALSAAAMSVGIGAPAHAVAVVPAVCTALPALLGTANANVGVTGTALNNANNAQNTAESEMNTAITEWVVAVSDLLKTIDLAGDVGAAQAIVDNKAVILANKVVAWGNAKVARFGAKHTHEAAEMSLSILSQLQSNLCP